MIELYHADKLLISDRHYDNSKPLCQGVAECICFHLKVGIFAGCVNSHLSLLVAKNSVTFIHQKGTGRETNI